MLDVIHALFEEDTLPRWDQDAEVKTKVRRSIYQSMYGEEYKYGYTSDQGRYSEWDSDTGSSGVYQSPNDGSIKPYIPPSDESELYDILGPPMGE